MKWLPIVDIESIMHHGRAWCPWRGYTHDAKPEAESQDASFSCEREMRPKGVAAASHTTRGPLATGRTAALAGRCSDSLPFP